MSGRESIAQERVELFSGNPTPQDRNILIGQMRNAARAEGKTAHDYQELRFRLEPYVFERRPEAVLLVARSALFSYGFIDPAEEREIVGFAAGEFRTDDGTTGFYLDGLYVSPAERNLGHGRALGEKVIGLATEAEASYVQVNREYTNDEAQKLFESLGFVATDSEYPRRNI